MAGDKCTHSGGGQGRQEGLGPTTGSLATAGTLAVSIFSHDCTISPWAYALQWVPVAGTELGIAAEEATGEYDTEDQ